MTGPHNVESPVRHSMEREFCASLPSVTVNGDVPRTPNRPPRKTRGVRIAERRCQAVFIAARPVALQERPITGAARRC